MVSRQRRPIIVSRNELDLAIRTRRKVILTFKGSAGDVQTATVLPLAVQSSDAGEYLLFQRGENRSVVALEDIHAFDFI